MPLIGKHVLTGERLDITTVESPRSIWKPGDVICPLCGEPMIVKSGLIKIPHFAHKVTCNTDYRSHPESAEHIAGKLFVAEQIEKHVAQWDYVGHVVEFEYPVREVKRIIDVALLFPSGWIVAHEVQLANITVEDLEERTNDYARAGVDVVWWLGKRANTPSNREWCISRFGQCQLIHFKSGDDVFIGAQGSGDRMVYRGMPSNHVA